MSKHHCTTETSLGTLTLVAEADSLAGVYFPHHWHLPAASEFGTPVDAHWHPVLATTATQLREYLDGTRTSFDIPITLSGTPLQRRVWELLQDVPYGETVTYGELATALGDTTAWEVGQIVGRNPISIVVPCHRVVGKNGKLTGYAGGLTRKRQLLDREESATSRLSKLF
jgi:methylated-DNA-[protein]-cysteine S-methyltransferase